MVDITYPVALGYANWQAWREYPHDEPILDSEFRSANLPPVSRPVGVLRWRGTFSTPAYSRSDSRWMTMRTLMESVDSGVNVLVLTFPRLQQAGLPGITTTLRVQPTQVRPPVHDNRGAVRGWTVDWVEA